MKMVEEFLYWLDDEAIPRAIEIICSAVCSVVCLIAGIATLPLWIIPFAFWYFFVYNAKQDKSKKVSDTWKQQTMSRFERVE